MTDPGTVRAKDDGDGVTLLVLDHPPVNSLSSALLGALGAELSKIGADPTRRAVVLTGDGAYFSAGADLKELATLRAESAGNLAREGQQLFSRLAALSVPTIAAVNGLAVGGGLELALACDVRVGGDAAKFGAPEVGYGLMPAFGGTQRLPRLVGAAKAREMIYTGSLLTAAEAHRIGLVNRVVPSGQELRAARDLAHTIAGKAPRAVAAAKRVIAEGLERPLSEGLSLESETFLREVMPTEDLREGLRAFAERRPPKFQGA